MIDFKYITKKQADKICSAVTDIETGSFFLKPDKGNKYVKLVLDAVRAKRKTPEQKEIVELRRVFGDYDYAKSNGYLDENDRFVEIKYKDDEQN